MELINDEDFCKVRDMCGIQISDLSHSLFSFDKLEKGGGKGGSLMQFTLDGRLLVKQLSGDDQASLQEYGPGYCERVTASQGDSLLARLFFHFKRVKDGKFYVVMNSIFPAGNNAPDTIWDLKGCADDKLVREHGKSVAQVHKRWFMLHWLVSEATGGCMLPQERKEYKQGKIRARTETFTLEQNDFSAVTHAVRPP